MTRPRKNPGASRIRTRDLPLSRRTPYHLANEAVIGCSQEGMRTAQTAWDAVRKEWGQHRHHGMQSGRNEDSTDNMGCSQEGMRTAQTSWDAWDAVRQGMRTGTDICSDMGCSQEGMRTVTDNMGCTGVPVFKSLVWTPKKWRKRDSNPGSSALEADALQHGMQSGRNEDITDSMGCSQEGMRTAQTTWDAVRKEWGHHRQHGMQSGRNEDSTHSMGCSQEGMRTAHTAWDAVRKEAQNRAR